MPSWNGDFSTGDLSQYVNVFYDRAVDRMVVVDDPTGRPRKALKITVHNHSKDPAQNSPKHRAQAESPKIIGLTDEVWIGKSYFLPMDFPTVHGAGPVVWGGPAVRQCSLWEIHGTPYGGSPPLGFRIKDSGPSQRFLFFEGSPSNAERASTLFSAIPGGPRGKWVDVITHFKMSTSSTVGFCEQWLNWGDGLKVLLPKRMMATVRSYVNGGGRNFSKVSLYTNHNAWPVATIFVAGHRIGNSLAEVNPNSYGTFGAPKAPEPTPVPEGPYADVVRSDNPLGYWRLDETSGTVVHSGLAHA